MSGLRGLAVGVVGLSFLEFVVSNDQAAGRIGGLFTVPGAVLGHWLDPTVPLVPDLSGNTGGSTTHIEANAYQTPTAPYQSTPRATAATPQPAVVSI